MPQTRQGNDSREARHFDQRSAVSQVLRNFWITVLGLKCVSWDGVSTPTRGKEALSMKTSMLYLENEISWTKILILKVLVI